MCMPYMHMYVYYGLQVDLNYQLVTVFKTSTLVYSPFLDNYF